LNSAIGRYDGDVYNVRHELIMYWVLGDNGFGDGLGGAMVVLYLVMNLVIYLKMYLMTKKASC